MIKSYKHKGLERLHKKGEARGVRPDRAEDLKDLLDRLDAAASVGDMNFPGARLHPWKPKGLGLWSVDLSGNYRLIFRFKDGDAYDLDLVDPTVDQGARPPALALGVGTGSRAKKLDWRPNQYGPGGQ